MRKAILTLSLALTALTASVAPALAAESWTCKYKGAWVTTASGNSDNFNWTVYWVQSEEGWHILGNFRDKYGFSWLDGNCADNSCDFIQTYKEGKLKGKSYYWTGDYTDKTQSAGVTHNYFEGTWGYSADNYEDGGNWKAQAICIKNPAGFNVDKALKGG